MRCVVCDKESKNLRVCPYCFTPYPTDPGPQRRATSARQTPNATGGSAAGGASPAGSGIADRASEIVGRALATFQRQTPLVRYTSVGIALVLLLWWATSGEPQFETGVVQSDIIATPMQREEALAFIKQTRETAIVDVQQDEVFVSYAAAAFPMLEAGQLALVQQFTTADEIVEGRKRRIYYYNPNGKLFAQADGVRGVVLVR